jgi:hypothetical protein
MLAKLQQNTAWPFALAIAPAIGPARETVAWWLDSKVCLGLAMMKGMKKAKRRGFNI